GPLARGRPPRCTPARHGEETKMPPPLESSEVGDQKFAAPDLPIGAIAGPIECYAYHLAAQMVFRHATGDMGVVMLHANFVLQRQFESETRAHVLRMQVVRHRSRFNPEKL